MVGAIVVAISSLETGVLGPIERFRFVPAGRFTVIACGLLLVVAARLALLHVRTDGDLLMIRNFARSYTFERSGIERFDVVEQIVPKRPPGRVVYVRLAEGGAHRLQSTKRLYVNRFSCRAPPTAPNEADDICADLNRWLNPAANLASAA